MSGQESKRFSRERRVHAVTDPAAILEIERWQFLISDLLILPLVIACSILVGRTVYFGSLSLSDSLFGTAWMDWTISTLQPLFASTIRGRRSLVACSLAIPSMCSLLLLSGLFAATRTRLGIGLTLCIPFGSLVFASLFPCYDRNAFINKWDLAPIIPYWVFAFYCSQISSRLLFRRSDVVLLAYRVFCWLLLALLVGVSVFKSAM